MNQKERYYEIDLFRFLAAISVVFFHYTFGGYNLGATALSFPELSPISKYGYLGVDFFFMISGFVILLTVWDKDFKGFVISRITRLYPAFWIGVSLTTLATLSLSDHNITLIQYLANLSMVSDIFGIKAIDGVYWTLLVEIRFYFLIAVVMLFNHIKQIKYYLSFWLVISIGLSVINELSIIKFLLMPQWSSYFIAGAVFYLIRKEGASRLYFLIILAAYLLSIKQACWNIKNLEELYQASFSIWIVIAIISLFYIALLMVSINKTAFINKKSMLSLGVLTYPLYLIHQNIGFILFNVFIDNNKYLSLLVIIVLMITLSYAISCYMEKAIAIKLKRTLLKVI